MGFHFPLSALLRLREIAEQREERLLGQILNQMAQSRQTLAELEVQRNTLIAQHDSALRQSTSAYEINGFYRRKLQIDDLERAGIEHLAKLSMLRDQQMRIYEAAHRSRELLSSMKDSQLEEFQRERTRQDQNAMDDNFSSRRRLH